MLKSRRTRLALMALCLLVFAGVLWGSALKKAAPVALAQVSQSWHSEQKAVKADRPEQPEKQQESLPVLPASPPSPPPRPKWLGMQDRKLDEADNCFKLQGLGHHICKCWSAETYGDGRGISRYLYHVRNACTE